MVQSHLHSSHLHWPFAMYLCLLTAPTHTHIQLRTSAISNVCNWAWLIEACKLSPSPALEWMASVPMVFDHLFCLSSELQVQKRLQHEMFKLLSSAQLIFVFLSALRLVALWLVLRHLSKSASSDLMLLEQLGRRFTKDYVVVASASPQLTPPLNLD